MTRAGRTHAHTARLVAKILLTSVVIAVAGSVPAAAKPDHGKGHPGKGGRAKPVTTKIRFKLDDHDVVAGDAVTSTIKVTSGKGRRRTPLAGAELSIRIDHEDVGTLTTGEDGTAALEVVAEEGEHVVKVFYAGDATHKRARRAQGYEAVAAEVPDDGTGDVPDDSGDDTDDGTGDVPDDGTGDVPKDGIGSAP